MTTTQILVIVAVVAVIALLAVRGWGGPKVTTIETVRAEYKGEDQP